MKERNDDRGDKTSGDGWKSTDAQQSHIEDTGVERPEALSPEQIAQLQDLLDRQAAGRPRGRVREWFRKNQERARTLVNNAAPRDEETDFDEDTLTGRLAALGAAHRAFTAVLALVVILAAGAFWSVIFSGGVSPFVLAGVGIFVVVTALGALVLMLLRRSR